jgi:hypothetical protein
LDLELDLCVQPQRYGKGYWDQELQIQAQKILQPETSRYLKMSLVELPVEVDQFLNMPEDQVVFVTCTLHQLPKRA